MMIVDLEEWHLERITLQPAQTTLSEALACREYRQMLASFESFAALDGERVIGVAGAMPQGNGRAVVWALLSADVPMLAAHRAVKRWLNACSIRRLETWVMVGHREGERWAEMLGFEREGRMRKFTDDGSDAWLYARVL